MIDFRYHAMSLVAVLVALALGLLLGVTIGDKNLVSNFQGGLEESLRNDVESASKNEKEAKNALDQQNEFIAAAYPQMVENRLFAQKIAFIGTAGVDRANLKGVTAAVEPAGASVVYAGELLAQPRYQELAAAIGEPQLIDSEKPTSRQTDQLGRAVGRRLARGRSRVAMRRFVFSRLSGRITRVRLFAFARQEPENAKTNDGKLLDGFERGVAAGLSQQAARVAGVETSATDPSNIKWYNSLGLSSVDNIENYAGRYSLVLIFGGAKGAYGFKDTADAVIPPVAQ
ncbi:MAG: copper transporter [Solirubrobacterales bacterium]